MKLIFLCGLLALAGCDNKPKHYLVLCDAKDSNDWQLIDSQKKDGYLISCTYQSPDKQGMYTRRCDNNGCNITK